MNVIKADIIRVRTAGASRRSEALWREAQLSGRHLFPHSVDNQDNSPTGRTFGRVSPLCENLASLPWGSSLLRRTGRLASVSADEDLPLDLKQGTPWTSNHGAGGRCFHLGSRKNLPKWSCETRRGARGWRGWESVRGALALLRKGTVLQVRGRNHSQKNACEIL